MRSAVVVRHIREILAPAKERGSYPHLFITLIAGVSKPHIERSVQMINVSYLSASFSCIVQALAPGDKLSGSNHAKVIIMQYTGMRYLWL